MKLTRIWLVVFCIGYILRTKYWNIFNSMYTKMLNFTIMTRTRKIIIISLALKQGLVMWVCVVMVQRLECYFMWINTLRPRQNGRHFADDMLKCIFLNENVWTPIEISLKFVPKGSINNNPALFQIMAWRRPGDKPLSEPMMIYASLGLDELSLYAPIN